MSKPRKKVNDVYMNYAKGTRRMEDIALARGFFPAMADLFSARRFPQWQGQVPKAKPEAKEKARAQKGRKIVTSGALPCGREILFSRCKHEDRGGRQHVGDHF